MDHDDHPKHKSREERFGECQNHGQTCEGLSFRRGIQLAIEGHYKVIKNTVSAANYLVPTLISHVTLSNLLSLYVPRFPYL